MKALRTDRLPMWVADYYEIPRPEAPQSTETRETCIASPTTHDVQPATRSGDSRDSQQMRLELDR